MSIAWPTNRDENWRYANLRPLARARVEDARASQQKIELDLPPALPGYQRWHFANGHMAGSDASPDARVKLLDARQAGESFAALLDADLHSAGVDFALARINAAQGDEVLQIELPDDSSPLNLDLLFFATASAS